ncbi:hypothetical protein EYD45_06890 [Hyunsoonleella flava]|uniref:Uncharacterized protein n=1 Tax=Hyunsoonleella flava TaxID=2527939 RepID=A0A4Q9FJZ7_9FLAO|nr:hypothetical protein [Hyunsoonleella flava]TBN04339.1 hypothetical protein EYD45_06890 [Hyunsoonleella flava]
MFNTRCLTSILEIFGAIGQQKDVIELSLGILVIKEQTNKLEYFKNGTGGIYFLFLFFIVTINQFT